jgi:hypothetical protein
VIPTRDLVRKITKPARGSDGLCIQPDDASPDREKYENHQRLRAAAELDYADKYTGNTRTHDEVGDYNCGRCNKQQDGQCLELEYDDAPIKVDVSAGSCRYWENQCAGDPEAWMLYSSVDLAAYAIAANGRGWGCHRCPFGEPAKRADSVGRSLYCKKIDARVYPTACCAINGAKVVPIGDDGQPTGFDVGAVIERHLR